MWITDYYAYLLVPDEFVFINVVFGCFLDSLVSIAGPTAFL